MRLTILSYFVASLAAGGLVAQTPAAAEKKTAVSKKSTPAVKRKAAVTKASPSTAKLAAAKTAAPAQAPAAANAKRPAVATTVRRRSQKGSKPVVASRRPTQQQPAPERLKEIQQALADKGYFSGPVDGTWGPSSVDAMKRFQREESLADDGKIGSLALIGLGLGPKRTVPVESAASDHQTPQQQ